MRNKIGLMAAAFLMAATVWAAMPLDGTKWKVKVEPDDESKKMGGRPFSEEIQFADGKATMVNSLKHGFTANDYTAVTRAQGFAWVCKQESLTEGVTAQWTGTAMKKTIVGALEWRAQDGKVLHYEFEGDKQK